MPIARPKPFNHWIIPVPLKGLLILLFVLPTLVSVALVTCVFYQTGQSAIAHQVLRLSLLPLGLAIALGLFAIHRITIHLAELNRMGRLLTAGNLDQRLPTDSPINAINRLAQTFNQLAEQLQQSAHRITTALSESEERFTTIFRSSPDPILLITLAEGRCVEANGRFLDLLEYRREELIGQRLLDLGIWQHPNDYTDLQTGLLQQGQIRNLEVRFSSRNGHVKTLLLSAELIVMNGEPCVLGIGRDMGEWIRLETERNQAELALRESEATNQALLQSIPDLFIHMDRHGKYLRVLNPGNLSLFNPSKTTPGNTIFDVLPHDLAQQRMDYIQLALQTRIPQSHEYQLEIGGKIQYEEARITPCADGTVLIIVRNISDRKVTELALQRSEARYRAIVEDQTELIIRFLPDTTMLFVNDAYCRYFGIRQEDVIGKSYNPNIYADDRERVAQLVQSLSIDNPTVIIENRAIVHGTIRWTQWVNRMLFDEWGNTTEIQSVGRDITELKQIEEALRKSEANLISAQQIAHVGSWEVDLLTRESIWSEEFCRICGLDPRHAPPLFSELTQYIPIEDREVVTTAIRQMILNKAAYEIEHRIQRPDGTIRHVISKGQVVLSERQQAVKLYGTVLDITDRKHADVALQESEIRFRQLAEAVREGFFVYEIESAHYSYFNPAYATILGISDQSLNTGMDHWLDHIHPDDRERVEKGLWQEGQGTNFNEEYRFIRPDGKVHWLRSQAFPLRNETGNLTRIVGTVEDITDRKLFEVALQNSEATLKKLLSSANASIASFRLFPDRRWLYEYWSEGCESVFGYTAAELSADPNLWFSRVFPEDIAQGRVVNLESFMLDYPITTQGEYRFFHKDGSLRWSSFQASARPDERSGWVVTIVDVDITNLKQIEDALRQSEERFRRAFDDAPIGISLVSPSGHFIKVNPAYCNMLGYTEAELLKLNFQSVTHPADLKVDVEGFQNMLTGETRSFHLEKRYITKQGIAIPVIMKTAPIRDENGQVLYCVGHIQDIRDRLKVERMKDEFISIISHELRTPLTSIRGALGLLRSGVYHNRPEKASHMLQIAMNNSERLVHLVNDILDLERLVSGKVQLVMEPCQVADLMQQAVDSVQAIADQSAITLSMTPLTATLWAAPDAIMQTLINLLSNAIKFSFTGGMVWLQATVDDGQWNSNQPVSCILFSVRDQGRGIPADKLDIIFEKFQQVDVSDARRKGGTGLGLAICKQIVQQHGGRIWAESVLGEGSTFYFTLPLAEKTDHD